MNNNHSNELFEKAKKYFPGGVNSPVRAFRSVGGAPLFIKKGKGAHIWDEDGNEFIDYCCSWGPLIHGHADERVVKAITTTAENGTSFGAPTALENELAELILNNNPFIEKLRFVSSGTEAVMSAVRLARGYTGKNKILKFEGCYHGHSDSLLVKAGSGLVTFGNTSSAGVPAAFVNETIVVPLNNIKAVEEAFAEFGDDIACVIIEPIPANNGLLLQEQSYLEFLRTITKKYNSLLFFDEVISGFRIGFTGAAGYYKIQPDIITYGKIIGGGLPVGAYGASAEIMAKISPDGDVYQGGTLSGNPVAMAAGIAQLKTCLEKDFYGNLELMCDQLMDGIRLHISKHNYPVKLFSIGSIFWIAFSEKEKIQCSDDIDPKSMEHFKKFYHALLERGIYIGPSGYEVGFVSSAHTENDIRQSIKSLNEALDFVFN
ncbi:glutamate-1-semialdehyde 2,1-aminomutase [soil metagenome]